MLAEGWAARGRLSGDTARGAAWYAHVCGLRKDEEPGPIGIQKMNPEAGECSKLFRILDTGTTWSVPFTFDKKH